MYESVANICRNVYTYNGTKDYMSQPSENQATNSKNKYSLFLECSNYSVQSLDGIQIR